TPLRLMQGFGMGQVVSLALVAVWRAVEGDRARGMAGYAVAVYFASLAGPGLAGLLVDQLSWRWMFWMIAPGGLFCLACALLWLDLEEAPRPPARLDVFGLLLLLAWITSLNVVL